MSLPCKKTRTLSNNELSSSCQAQLLFLILLRCRNCYTSSFTPCSALLPSLQNALDMIEWGRLSEIWNLLQHIVKMGMNDAGVGGLETSGKFTTSIHRYVKRASNM